MDCPKCKGTIESERLRGRASVEIDAGDPDIGKQQNAFAASPAVAFAVALLIGCGSTTAQRRELPPSNPKVATAPAASRPRPLLLEFPLDGLPYGGAEERVLSVAAGSDSTCALLRSRTVWCWGHGVPDQVHVQIPVEGVAHLRVADEQFLAVTTGGDVFAWGKVPERSTVSATPVRLPVSAAMDASANANETCVLGSAGAVTCWGPDGKARDVGTFPFARKLAHSTELACVLLEGGRVTCWRPGAAPRPREDVSAVTDLVSAGDLICILVAGGEVRCWKAFEAPQPFPIALPRPTRRLVGGTAGVCAFGATGLPICVDRRAEPERDGLLRSPDLAFPHATDLETLSIADEHACALLDGDVHCWGDSDLLGRSDVTWNHEARVHVRLGDTPSLRRVKAFAPGADHRCALIDDGTVRCWGKNDQQELGLAHGETLIHARLPRTGPEIVPDLGHATQVAVTRGATCVLGRDGILSCFGEAPGHESPRDAADWYSPPVPIATQVADFDLGDGFGCFITLDRRVYCWGRNDRGQLGTGDGVDSKSPLPVQTRSGPLREVATLRVFEDHACAITGTGVLQCWGSNAPFEQGRPYNTPPVIPVATPVPGVASAADVSDRCVLSRSGELRCWGNVFEDERAFTYEPRRIGVCGVQAIAAGPGVCFRDARGATCLGGTRWVEETRERGGYRMALPSISRLSGNERELCAVDDQGGLHCMYDDGGEFMSSIGLTSPEWVPWPAADPSCPRDPLPTTIPLFPPIPPASVVALTRGPLGEDLGDLGVALTPRQVSELVDLLNDPGSYSSIATCHHARHEYEFRDRVGRPLATVTVGNCITLQASPHIPAQERIGGNLIAPKMAQGLTRLCRELRLQACGE